MVRELIYAPKCLKYMLLEYDNSPNDLAQCVPGKGFLLFQILMLLTFFFIFIAFIIMSFSNILKVWKCKPRIAKTCISQSQRTFSELWFCSSFSAYHQQLPSSIKAFRICSKVFKVDSFSIVLSNILFSSVLRGVQKLQSSMTFSKKDYLNLTCI